MKSGSDNPHVAARSLLRMAYHHASRDEFLVEASRLVLRVLDAERLEIYKQDGQRWYLFEASADPPSYRLHRVEGPREAVGPDVAGLPLEIEPESRGRLQIRRRGGFSPSELSLAERVAQLLGAAIAAHRSRLALGERVKELTCMYAIARIAADSERPLAEMLDEIVQRLPAAWQYPELTTARLTIGDHHFVSPNFEEGPHRLSSAVRVGGSPPGILDVYYLERGRQAGLPDVLDQDPFLPEELNLIEGVAREIALIIERSRAEDERARLSEQVRQADRLATIGQLAAGVAHELNEPLSNILGFAQLAQKTDGLPGQTQLDLGRIVTASLYAREVVRKLMLFYRQEPTRRVTVPINRVVDDALALLETRCAEASIQIERELAVELPSTHGDPAQLQQVLVNLAVNAIQAMPEGGELRVTTALDNGRLVIRVRDTGVGMPEDVQRSMFLPFFTTKDVGQGTGLGLSVAHGIVTAHNGTIEVRSQPGLGTCMSVTLPPSAPDEAVAGGSR